MMCTLLYKPLLLISDQPTTVTSSSHAHGPLSLAAAVSACADQQFGTNFHRICEAQTLGNSLNISLRDGCLSVHTAGSVSDRHRLKVHLINGLTYLHSQICLFQPLLFASNSNVLLTATYASFAML